MEAIRNYTVIDTCSEKWLLPSTTYFSTKTRPFPNPWLPLVNFEPNISCIYTPKLKSWLPHLRSSPKKMERIESSETSALKAQTPGDYSKKHSTAESLLFTWLLTFTGMPWEQASGTSRPRGHLKRPYRTCREHDAPRTAINGELHGKQYPFVLQTDNYVTAGDTTTYVLNGATCFDLLNRSSSA